MATYDPSDTSFFQDFFDSILEQMTVPICDELDELHERAMILAVEEYENGVKNPQVHSIYTYIMDRYAMPVSELVEIIASAFMLRIAVQEGKEALVDYQKDEFLEYISWFAGKRNFKESSAYEYLLTLFVRALYLL